ncbi:MAG: thioredoxin domain-containing protein [Thaumarchaeota archaeon]|nr:thioredoxin domain-containing protein [Nitrososphaerota archaeon]MBT4057424.1 thioredoxin domain-containing protein [Nitrososphaerota archaeon]MBT4176297.1 thioredoxin domain-containing protein [Nitrososphaerota archaeon]MBT4676161.1 thioredoxin domain-containing protein [Nitrososphaerota archaeon]
MPNNLSKETSPYLLQHKDNPVEWYSWNDESLKKAKDENKPIFLSVGYSSCHWCHVMAHESFENDDVAKIMNENFVNIKVDREERPDLDDIYQKICQMSTGQGGWPLSVFLTPEQKPFYVGTYFPVLDSYGRPGFGSLCRQLAQAWKEKPKDVGTSAEQFMSNLTKLERVSDGGEIEKAILDEAAVNLLQVADTNYGGFGQAPKFPNAANLSFMFRYSKLSGITKFQEFALMTLKKMAKGGIFDQIGGGFHRYSTDGRWLVPHFEKMLYDNALLPPVYAEAYQITKDPFYLGVVTKTLDYVMREMTSTSGLFYSAQDADTNGEEGQTFVWKKREIENILGDDSEIFCIYYDVTDGGNFEGNTILANNINISSLSFKFNKTEDEITELLKRSSKKLLDIRSKRDQPGTDDKIITSWNSMMISAFAKGYRISGNEKYLNAATNAAKYFSEQFSKYGFIHRTFKNDIPKLNGYLDDYAYLVNSLIDVFEITSDAYFLDMAQNIANYMIEHFWNENEKSFYFTADTHESLIVRPKNYYDLSVPSGNSVAANALLKLHHLVNDKKFLKISKQILELNGTSAAENPFAFGYLLNVMNLYLKHPTEITIINSENSEIVNSLYKKFIPEGIIIQIKDKENLELLSKYSFFEGKEFSDKTNVTICKNFTCSLPLSELSKIEEIL